MSKILGLSLATCAFTYTISKFIFYVMTDMMTTDIATDTITSCGAVANERDAGNDQKSPTIQEKNLIFVIF